jgi:hypothetical protein
MGGRGSSSGKASGSAGGASILSGIIQQSPESALSQLSSVMSQDNLEKGEINNLWAAEVVQAVRQAATKNKLIL